MNMKALIAAAALSLTAGAAAADDGFIFPLNKEVAEGKSTIELPVINAAKAGFVEIRTFEGQVVGREDVMAGANNDVRVNLDETSGELGFDLLAVLVIDGMDVATQRIYVEDNE
ncbi:MAG: hypothetical protein ACU0CO_05120 [Shimia sp.]